MLPATPSPIVSAWFGWYCRSALRKFFHRLHLFGDVPFEPGRSTLYVCNHASFWDALLMNHLIRTHRPQPAYCMADAVQVAKHPFFRRIGAFSVDRTSPRDGLRAVRYAADLLNRPPCAVVVFPQGEVEPADKRPLGFERGIDRILSAAPDCRVICVALRYEFWLEQRAEAMIDLTVAGQRTTTAIERQIAERVDTLAAAGRAWRPGQILLSGKRSVSRRTERAVRDQRQARHDPRGG